MDKPWVFGLVLVEKVMITSHYIQIKRIKTKLFLDITTPNKDYFGTMIILWQLLDSMSMQVLLVITKS
jgi:hypothetical protein